MSELYGMEMAGFTRFSNRGACAFGTATCSRGVMPVSGSTASVTTGISGGELPESVNRAVNCVVTVCAARFVEHTARRDNRRAARIEGTSHTALNAVNMQGALCGNIAR